MGFNLDNYPSYIPEDLVSRVLDWIQEKHPLVIAIKFHLHIMMSNLKRCPMMSLIGWAAGLASSMAGLAASSSGACLLGQRLNQILSVSLVVVWSKSCSAQLCLHSSGTLREARPPASHSSSVRPSLLCEYQPLARSPDSVLRSVYNTHIQKRKIKAGLSSELHPKED